MTQEALDHKKLFIKTYGCQMNVYDSIKMGDLLKPHGFLLSEDANDADLVILNTCHIREKAAEKVYCELGRIREQKEKRKSQGEQMVIAVAGCVAQAEGEEIFTRAPFVDIVVGPQSYHNLPKLLEKVKRKEKWAMDLDFPAESKFDSIRSLSDSQGSSAFIAIQEGCDKFCHFCVVPYTRGAEYSRPVAEIYREALALVSNGTKEIQLLGQNVSAYHGEGSDGEVWSLGKLIKHIAKIDGLERLRYTTSHPRDMVDDELFDAHATESKLMPFLHLPIQSGSNRILEAMNRKHTREFYLEVIEQFKKARPDMGFSSDFIVGYPGETDEDFAETLRIVQEVEFSQCYSFKYSPRPGTPASMLETQVPEEVKSARLLELQELIKSYQAKFNQRFLGQTIKVLFDKEGKHDGQLLGRSEHMQAVFAEAPISYLNKIIEVEVYRLEPNSLACKLPDPLN
jgi:tRNA-2-methylthio-N6-dimethylallyladenosine synthase